MIPRWSLPKFLVSSDKYGSRTDGEACGHTEDEVGPLSSNAKYDQICDDCLNDG